MRSTNDASVGSFLSDDVRVRQRFLRSVNIESDFRRPGALEGYILTPAGDTALARLSEGVHWSYSRAFSLTGAYGSGKSAFALFASRFFAPKTMGEGVHEIAFSQSPKLREVWNAWGETGLLPVLIVGSREPVARSLVSGLLVTVQELPSKLKSVRSEIGRACRTLLETGPISDKDVVILYEAAAALISQALPECRGLFVVVDEMGKFLEYAALHPDQGDLQAFQALAEAACRTSEYPIWLVTVLHQAFEEYAQRLGTVQRREWQKVQGRFSDIPFGDAQEDITRLIAKAIELSPSLSARNGWETLQTKQVEESRRLSLFPATLTASEFGALLRETYPLHPLVLRILPQVFRRFGQNERTLFAFLSSEEPHGFQTFLRTYRWNDTTPPLFTLDLLYDYLIATVGTNLYVHSTGKLWSQVAETLLDVRAESPLKSRLIKTIGLLHILGEQTRILPSAAVLNFALSGGGITPDEIEEALEDLKRKTLIVYRRFKGAYRLYEGSDVDVDARLRDAAGYLGLGTDSVQVASTLGITPPMVARRHSYRTGTLRVFDVRFCRLNALQDEILAGRGEADGVMLLCMVQDVVEEGEATRLASELLIDRADILLGICTESEALRETAIAVNSLLWVQENTAELRNDRVASREVRERLQEATEAFEAEWDRILNSCETDYSSTQWLYCGKSIVIHSRRQLQETLSRIADEAYPFTPVLRNELINRRQISSTAAAARQDLVEAMLTHRHVSRLGIDGFPPQYSMYVSLFEVTGIHREENDQWGFYPPDDKVVPELARVWVEVENFLFYGNLQVKPLQDLYDLLKEKPLGLTDGVIPALLCAVLLYNEKEIALYEDGRFVTEWTAAIFERLMRRPQDFGVRGCRIAGERQIVINRFARGLLSTDTEPTLVNVVRRLFREFNRLKEYTLRTRRLSPMAIGLRELFRESREPDQLLFVDLPLTLGVSPFAEELVDEKNSEEFFRNWNEAMSALVNAYEKLLDRVEQALCKAFEVSDWIELRDRTTKASPSVTEPKLRSFILRAANADLGRKEWLEAVAAGMTGRPPESWTDAEEDRFTSLLPSLARVYQHSEALHFEISRRDDTEERIGYRLAITHDTGAEESRIALIPKHDEKRLQELANEALAQLDTILNGLPRETQVAVLALVAEELLKRKQDD